MSAGHTPGPLWLDGNRNEAATLGHATMTCFAPGNRGTMMARCACGWTEYARSVDQAEERAETHARQVVDGANSDPEWV